MSVELIVGIAMILAGVGLMLYLFFGGESSEWEE
jgi:hypothetical protein